MNRRLSQLLGTCITLHKAVEQNEHEYFLKRYFGKRYLKKAMKELENDFNDMMNDEWDLEYLLSTQRTILLYHEQFGNFEDGDVSIPSFDPNNINNHLFYPIYFQDFNWGDPRTIILEVISDNINFTIFDPSTGNSFTASSKYSIQSSQKKIEKICKQILIDYFIEFIYKK